MEPTTEMAEIAFVNDISGVCNSRDTRPMTPSPTKVARTRTESELQFASAAASIETDAEAAVDATHAAAAPHRDTDARTMI